MIKGVFCSFQIQQYDAANYAGHQFNEYWPQQQPQHLRTSISGNSPSPHSSPSLASEEYDYNSQQHHSATYFNMYYHHHQQHQNGFQYTQQQSTATSGTTLSPLAAGRMSGHSPGAGAAAGVPAGSDPMSTWPSEM